MHPKVLFLDFDGVLHPEGKDDLRHAWLLGGLVARADIRVVLSTNWRLSNSLGVLRRMLPGWELERQVIDMTPELPVAAGCRQREIEAWLATHPTERFAVLDDNAWLFEDPEWAPLVLCNPAIGLTPEALIEVKARLGL